MSFLKILETFLLYMTVFDKKKKLNKNLLKEIEELYRTSYNSIDRYCPRFPILEGITVKVTQNIILKLGIANGTEGNIIVAEHPNGYELQSLNLSSVQCSMSSNQPSAVFLD